MVFRSFAVPFNFLSCLLFLGMQNLSFNAHAVPIQFSDESLFNHALSSLSEVTYIDFETEAKFGERVGGGREQYSLPGVSISAPLPALKVMSGNISGTRNTTVGGRNYLAIDTDLNRKGTITTFDFEDALQAISFDIVDHDGSEVLIWVGDDRYVLPEAEDGEATFFGLIFDERFVAPKRLLIDSLKDPNIAIDELQFLFWPNNIEDKSINVSEPASVLLMFLGLILLHLGRKRSAQCALAGQR